MKLGYCCKYIVPANYQGNRKIRTHEMNMIGTTITKLKSMQSKDAMDKMIAIVEHNCRALRLQFEELATKPEMLRLYRIGSEIVPGATHEDTKWLYQHPEIKKILQKHLPALGEFARLHNFRLAMHPGQYVLFNSQSDQVVDRAIEEFEYHTDIMKLMGFGKSFHDGGTAINIHVGARTGGLQKTVDVINHRLSPEARNLITLENDEYSFGIDDLISINNHVAIVTDIHHDWIHSSGNFLQNTDDRIKRIEDSWRGIRPLGHFSTSHESCFVNSTVEKDWFDFSQKNLPNYNELILSGLTRNNLRAHSEFCYNPDINAWALSHLTWMDIEVEAKQKNIATTRLYEQWLEMQS